MYIIFSISKTLHKSKGRWFETGELFISIYTTRPVFLSALMSFFNKSGSVLPHQNWRDDSGGFPVQGGTEVFIVAAKGRDETPEVCGMVHFPCMAEFVDHYITHIFRRKEKQQGVQ